MDVLTRRALPFGIHIRAPDYWKRPLGGIRGLLGLEAGTALQVFVLQA